MPISLMLFGTLGVALGFDHDLARAPWALGVVLQFAALMLRTAVAEPSLKLPAILLLSVASLVVLWLSLATVRGLRNGSLLQPEPVAVIVPAAAVQGA